jgi:hypothetical protein
MLLVVLEEILGYHGLPGAHKHDPGGGHCLQKHAIGSQEPSFGIGVLRSHVQNKSLRTFLEKQ